MTKTPKFNRECPSNESDSTMDLPYTERTKLSVRRMTISSFMDQSIPNLNLTSRDSNVFNLPTLRSPINADKTGMEITKLNLEIP